MAKGKGAKIRFIYGIFLSVFSIVVGVLFIIQTWSIYHSASQKPYTAESISAHFKQIALPVWLWIAAIFGNILLAILYPETEKRPKAYINTALSLERTKNSLVLEKELFEKASAKGEKEASFRTAVNVVCVIVLLAIALLGYCILFGLVYRPLFKTEFFAAHDSVADKLAQCVILSIVALLVICFAERLKEKSRKSERNCYVEVKAEQAKRKKEKKGKRWNAVIDKLIGALFLGRKTTWEELDKEVEKTLETPQPIAKKQTSKNKKKSKTVGVWSLRVAVFAVAVFLLVVGVQNGGMREVFSKAVNICTQCIGLG